MVYYKQWTMFIIDTERKVLYYGFFTWLNGYYLTIPDRSG